MKKLSIYICENYLSDYKRLVAREGYEDVEVRGFPCWCIRNADPTEFACREKEAGAGRDDDCVLICGLQCPLLEADLAQDAYRTVTFNYCQECLISQSMVQYIISRGGYLLSSGWLENWPERLREAGFDRDLARRFYGEGSQELVLLDTGFDPAVAENMQTLADYLDIPCRVIGIGADYATLMLRSVVYQWRLERQKGVYESAMARLRQESAEYSAVLNIIKRITVTHEKRAIINQLMEVCTMLFGGQKLRYFDRLENTAGMPAEIEDLGNYPDRSHVMSPDGSDVYIKINHQDEAFGVLLIGDFIFPQYLERYLELAISVAQISALALSNAFKIEELERSRDEMAYASYHDALTSLYNRAYFNKALEEQSRYVRPGVFVCDIDGLKYVNDTFGHTDGDGLIARAAEVLRHCFRETDILARIGGDEFAAIVLDCNPAIAGAITERIERSIQESNHQNPQMPYQLSLSVGYALQESPDERLEKLVHNADERMYDDKLKKKRVRGAER